MRANRWHPTELVRGAVALAGLLGIRTPPHYPAGMKAFMLALVVPLLTSCYSIDPITNEKPPRYSGGVSVALFDITPRPPTKRLDVMQTPTLPPNARIIARLSRPGAASKHAAMMNAIAWRARQIGADGILPVVGSGAPSSQVNVNVAIGQPWGWNKGKDPTYVADAFVYTNNPAASP